jgi:cell division protein FtsI (penicillin-binding protein 3)
MQSAGAIIKTHKRASPVKISSQIKRRFSGDGRIDDGTMKNLRIRVAMGMALFAVMFACVSLKMIAFASVDESEENPRIITKNIAANTIRADITDRNGEVLATSLPTVSLYANPRIIRNKGQTASQLRKLFPEFSESYLTARLNSKGKFVWIKRHLSPAQQRLVVSLGNPGLDFVADERRTYPFGNLASHALGFVDVDSNGLSGVERYYDYLLNSDNSQPKNLELSIDLRVQSVMHQELAQSIRKFSAIGGIGMITDINNGEVVAMVSMPDYDPNKPSAANKEMLFNRATLGTYEMGSTFKAITTAMALNSGNVAMDDIFDATNPIQSAGFRISDHHPKARPLSVPEIFMYSSNIGTVKMAQAAGMDEQKNFLEKLGLFRKPDIDLEERANPQYPAKWGELNSMTVSFGHGMAVTPSHLMQSVGSLLNGGVMRPLTLIKDGARAGERVISEDTSRDMRNLMRLVVEMGTGRKADVSGYLVGGKTGTAEKIVSGRYDQNAMVSSFIAAFPIDKPKYLVLIMLDEPKGIQETYGFATGGWTAAPTVGKIISRIGPILGMKTNSQESSPVFAGYKPAVQSPTQQITQHNSGEITINNDTKVLVTYKSE